MLTFKRTLSVLLCCVLLAAFAPLAHAEDVLIEKVSATYTVPAAGEPFDFGAITVPDGAQYTAKIAGVNYLDQQNKVIVVKSGDVAAAGVTYYVNVRFEAKYGYKLDAAKTEYVVNGETVTDIIAENENIVRTSFTTGSETPDDPAPQKLTFLQRAAQFFRNIYDRIRERIQLLMGLFRVISGGPSA